jgi:hypothetical protein
MVPIQEMGDVPPTPTQSQLSIKDASHLRGFIGCAETVGIHSVGRNATMHIKSSPGNIFLIQSPSFFLYRALSSVHLRIGGFLPPND